MRRKRNIKSANRAVIILDFLFFATWAFTSYIRTQSKMINLRILISSSGRYNDNPKRETKKKISRK